MRHIFRLLVLATSSFLLTINVSQAQEMSSMATNTLEKIRNYNAIYVGHQESSVPFSYLDNDGKVTGYSWELCQRITDAVKAKLNLPNLTIVPVPTTFSSHQILIEAGTTDLQCGSTANTEQRQRYVSFSVTVFVAGIKAIAKRGSGIRSIQDMKDKTVVTTSGTTSENYLRAAAARQNMPISYKLGRDHTDSMRQVLRGEADAMVLDDVLLPELLMSSPEADAQKLVVLDENYAIEPYGIEFRRNDPTFKKLVDETLVGLMKSGEFARIYTKWFLSPIPPHGWNLNLPMSDLLKQLTLAPNDKGI